MTIPNNTTYKLIGLAATGAAMLGMNLEDALCTDPAELARNIAAYLNRLTTPTSTVAAEAEEPAGICQLPRAPLPVPVPPSLRGPGEPIPDPGNIDWDDPETYR